MLTDADIIAIVPTANPDRAREFYEHTLRLKFVSDDPFAVVFDAHGTMLRVTKVEQISPAPYTVLGWHVADIVATVSALAAKGVTFERYEGMGQDDQGIWQSPGGARIAWFKDPDGNLLSLTQF